MSVEWLPPSIALSRMTVFLQKFPAFDPKKTACGRGTIWFAAIIFPPPLLNKKKWKVATMLGFVVLGTFPCAHYANDCFANPSIDSYWLAIFLDGGGLQLLRHWNFLWLNGEAPIEPSRLHVVLWIVPEVGEEHVGLDRGGLVGEWVLTLYSYR